MASEPFLGVDHIGVGVSDVERSIAFYARLGFTDVAFDYEGPLGGLGGVADRDAATARVVMLRPGTPTVLGQAAVKLVHTTDAPPPPMPDGMGWGEPGVCEVCVHVREQDRLYEELVGSGVEALMEPNESPLTPFGTLCSLSYVADPDGTKIELIEWKDLDREWPGEAGPAGVNHVAFGVADLEAARAFWTELGFTGMLFDSDGVFEPMDPWYAPRTPPRQKMTLLTTPRGAGLEPVEHIPPSPAMHGDWAHLGPFDFGVGTRNLDRAIAELGALGISLRGEPATVDLGDGATWRYAYFADPEGTRVCLSEARY